MHLYSAYTHTKLKQVQVSSISQVLYKDKDKTRGAEEKRQQSMEKEEGEE